MSDGIRRIAALGILLLGTGLLWLATRSTDDAANAKSDQSATLSDARQRAASNDPRLKGAYRYEEGGWVYVHLEGDPATLGFQHGFLLAPEIEDAFPAVSTNMMHSSKRDWAFFRKAAREMLWPKIDEEYQQELKGIVDGLHARTDQSSMSTTSSPSMPSRNCPTTTFRGSTNTKRLPNRSEPEKPRKLQRVRCHWQLDKRRHKSSWPTTIGPATCNGERWRIIFDIASEARLPHVDGRLSRRDRQRRRFRHQLRRPDGHRNHHLPI